jgi:hypothetical protein
VLQPAVKVHVGVCDAEGRSVRIFSVGARVVDEHGKSREGARPIPFRAAQEELGGENLATDFQAELPPGRYVLSYWTRPGQEERRGPTIEVVAGQPLSVELRAVK